MTISLNFKEIFDADTATINKSMGFDPSAINPVLAFSLFLGHFLSLLLPKNLLCKAIENH